MKKKLLLVACCLSLAMITTAQTISIVPKPAFAELRSGSFTISPSIKLLSSGDELKRSSSFFNDYLQKMYGFQLKTGNQTGAGNAIVLKMGKVKSSIKGGYEMRIEKNKIQITGADPEGVFYGIQSLIQLLPFSKTTSLTVPQMIVIDSARFAYRGMHLDVGRHFFDVDFVKKYIDLLASYKLNTFHWHLTDDQGWRIEIKKYPGLTQVGSQRNGAIVGHYPGKGNDNVASDGFYTQEQIKDVVAYAADRYITVIPEIELPGHGSAAIAAYPFLSCFPDRVTGIPLNMVSLRTVDEAQKGRIKFVQETWGVFDDVFCAGKETTFNFLQDVLDEVIALFPSKYIHIGGDECPKTFWKQCPQCQKTIAANHLKDEHALQSYFIQKMEKYVNGKGRNIIGWDEILEGGLAPNATVMSWRGENGGIEAAKQKHTVIMTPGSHCYFDHANAKNEDSLTIGGLLTVETVYSYNPIPSSLSAEEAKYIIGAQANLWTEYITNPAKVEYMILPRLGAMSEVLWTAKEKKSWNDFVPRMMNEFKRYDWLGLNYCKIFLRENPSVK
ncbi:MAG: beta-N-acetylhexosaminidase [Ferruginibacter sp.]|nr:beta-N-acetylhexosaminidase [Ferruginibacter sp.]